MIYEAMKRCRRPLRAGRFLRTFRRFHRDARGVAAVEFGLIAPILVLMLLGAVEITRAVSIDRRLTAVTNMVADLVAREEELAADDVTAIYDIARLVMSPYEAEPLKISPQTCSQSASTPVAQHRPSFNGGTQPARCQPYSLATGFLKEGTSLIVVEGSYEFTPLFGSSIIGPVEWTQTAYASPRKGCVEFYDKGQSPSQREKVCMTSTCFSS